MGNDTYSYINNEWQRMVPTYKVGIKQEMRKFKYDIENSLDHIFARDFETDSYLISPSYAFADMIAVVNGHATNPIIGRLHIATALFKGHEQQNHSMWQTIAAWLKSFGIITGICGLIFHLYRLFGGQSIMMRILGCMGLPIWITNLVSCNIFKKGTNSKADNNQENRIKNTSDRREMTPLKIINVPAVTETVVSNKKRRRRSASDSHDRQREIV